MIFQSNANHLETGFNHVRPQHTVPVLNGIHRKSMYPANHIARTDEH